MEHEGKFNLDLDSRQLNLSWYFFLASGLLLAGGILIAAFNSPRNHFRSSDKAAVREKAIYYNLGKSVKSMFFHELKKQKP